MIKYKKGNLLEAEAEALVNTVNCAGIMGKGIALQFKQAFPINFKEYEKACRANQVQIGKMFVVEVGSMFQTNPRYIVNFPTKNHWKGKSRLEDIKSGLEDLVERVKYLEIKSIAVPPLGCGNGGLEWAEVKSLMEKAFANLSDINIIIYEPNGTPTPESMRIATEKPGMTLGRALLIRLLELYKIPDYKLTSLEIQKLAYFLQEAGEPLKLIYVKEKYGPYANTLRHVLQKLEGHYTRGYGDGTKSAEIYLLPGAVEEATTFIENMPESKKRLERVANLIEGFETPYGMELLATVLWVAKETPEAKNNPDKAIEKVYEWNEHKREFRQEHIKKAWQQLQEVNWLENEEKLPELTLAL